MNNNKKQKNTNRSFKPKMERPNKGFPDEYVYGKLFPLAVNAMFIG